MWIIFQAKDGNQIITKDNRKKYKVHIKFRVKWLTTIITTQIKAQKCKK